MLGAGLTARVLGPTSSFMASAFKEHGLRESCWTNSSRERDRDECGIQSVASGSSLDPVFYGISAVHGKVAASPTPGIVKISSRRQLMG